MKRIWTLLAVLFCCAVLCACTAKGTAPSDTPASTETPVPTAETTPAAALPTEAEQRELIERNRALWSFPDDPWSDPWFYTVTDLDHNGRLEILAATTQGTGIFTYANYYEVNETGTALVDCCPGDEETEGADDWPEIILNTLPCFHDRAADRYYYTCEGVTREGAAHQYFGWYALCLKDGAAEWETIARKELEWRNGGEGPYTVCTDAAGNPIGEQDYDAAVEKRFAGLEKTELELVWTRVDPREANMPVADPPAAPGEPDAPPVIITKNPTGETVTPGSRTWFIAHADNAVSLTWLFTSPQGQTFTLAETMAANPGLRLEELELDTLAVSDIPASLDGWSVQARFDGPGGSAVTTAAAITVENEVMAYAEPLSRYFYAVSHGITDLSYAFENGISEFYTAAEHVGYALLDLDGDGTRELLVEGIGGDDFARGVLYDLYTLRDGVPVQIACSSARDRWYLRADYSLLNEGSGGAGHSACVLNVLQGDSLIPLEAVITYFANVPGDGFYHQTGGYSYEPRPGDEPLSEEEFSFYMRNWEAGVLVPELIQFA